MPSFAISFSSSTSNSTPSALERFAGARDEGLGIDDVGGLGDQLAGAGEALEQAPSAPLHAASAPSPAPTMTISSSVGFCLRLSLVR